MIRTIFVSLLLVASVSAQDYLGTFASYRFGIRYKLGIDQANNTYYSDSTLNQFVREGVSLLVPPTRAIQIKDTIYPVQFMKNTYELDSLVEGITSVLWRKGDSLKSLVRVPTELWSQQEHKSTVGEEGYLARPSYYDYLNGYLMLAPPPTVPNDTLELVGWKRVANIGTDAGLTMIDPKYRVVILNYAAWQAAAGRQHPREGALFNEFKESAAIVGINYGGVRVATPTGTTSPTK